MRRSCPGETSSVILCVVCIWLLCADGLQWLKITFWEMDPNVKKCVLAIKNVKCRSSVVAASVFRFKLIIFGFGLFETFKDVFLDSLTS